MGDRLVCPATVFTSCRHLDMVLPFKCYFFYPLPSEIGCFLLSPFGPVTAISLRIKHLFAIHQCHLLFAIGYSHFWPFDPCASHQIAIATLKRYFAPCCRF
jgi:hypothetical protein